MAKSDWPRWIHATVAKYLKQVAVTNSFPVLIEGIDDRGTEFMEQTNRVEIRVNGPFSREISKGYYEVLFDVNVLVNSRMDGEAKNVWTLDQILGKFYDAMDGPIAVFRVGTGPDDDESLLGCFQVRSGGNDYVRVHRFGQLSADTRLKQGMVDVSYYGNLDEE